MKITNSRAFILAGIAILGMSLAGPVFGSSITSHWVELSPSGGPPAKRAGHIAFCNPNNNRMIVFGGEADKGGSHRELNDVWILTDADGTDGTSTWLQLSPAGTPPSPRSWTSGAYDPANNRLIVYGGDPNVGSCRGCVNDTWVLTEADGTGATPQWMQLSTTGGPPPIRQNPRVAYDAINNRLIVFGGNDNACGTAKNEVWVLSNANGLGGAPVWTQLNPTGDIPSPRGGHAVVYDPITTRLLSFGGFDGTCLNEVKVLAGANGLGGPPIWSTLSPLGPLPVGRSSHTAVYDDSADLLIAFGGGYCTPLNNEAWVLENATGAAGTPQWTMLTPTGTPPSPRYVHTAVLNPNSGRMTVFGGGASWPTYLNDVWVLDVSVPADVGPPVAVCANIAVPLGIDGTAGIAANDVDGGSFSPAGNPITLSIDVNTFDCDDLGDNTVTLTVTDGELTDTCEATVTVVNAQPIAAAGPDTDVLVGLTVFFDGGGSTDPGGAVVSYTWDFGDGTPLVSSASPATQHAYADAGIHTVTLSVADICGAVGVDTLLVTVLTAEQGTQDLIDVISDDLDLPAGTENSLISKLDGAAKKLGSGKDEAATNMMGAFIHAVEAQRGKTITDEQADLLIQGALDILAAISS